MRSARRWALIGTVIGLAAAAAACTSTSLPGVPQPSGSSFAPSGFSSAAPLPTASGLSSAPVSSLVPTPSAPPLVPARVTLTGPLGPAHADDPVDLVAEVRTDDGKPVPGVSVSTTVAGPNAGSSITCSPVSCASDADGTVMVRYSGLHTGSDVVTVTAAALSADSAVSWLPSIRGSRVAVLGDSYSAGEGTGHYTADTSDSGANRCHRSPLAYGALLTTDLPATDLAFRACSGASTDDLFQANGAGNQAPDGRPEPAQLCSGDCGIDLAAAVGPDTRAVLLTVGGNDAGFSQALGDCIWISELHLNYGRPGRGCRNSGSLTSAVADRLGGLAGTATVTGADGRTISSYGAILTRIHTLAPRAVVYLVGYPQLFQPGSGDCFVGRIDVSYSGRQVSLSTKVTPEDARWLDDQADALNDRERQAVTAAGPWAHFVDTAAAFAGHGVCTGAPWINGDSGSLTITSASNVSAAIDAGSFHPNVTGQQQIAAAVRAAGFTD